MDNVQEADAPADDTQTPEASGGDAPASAPEERGSLMGSDNEPPEGSEGEAPAEGEEAPKDKPEGEDGDKDEEKEGGAPEAYEDFTIPENLNMDKEVLGEFSEQAKELNLTQEQAQGLVDLQVKMEAKRTEAWNEALDGWETSAKNDPEFGGAKFNQTLATAAKARDHFGNDEFKAMLNQTGVGSHPEMIRFMHKIGASIGEDTPPDGGMSGSADTSLADKMYNSK